MVSGFWLLDPCDQYRYKGASTRTYSPSRPSHAPSARERDGAFDGLSTLGRLGEGGGWIGRVERGD